jgi:hypothetical protein
MTRGRAGVILGAAIAVAVVIAVAASSVHLLTQSLTDEGPLRIDPAALAKLDPDSRDLALVIDRGEWVDSTLQSTNGPMVADVARARGFVPTAAAGNPDDVNVRGPIEDVLALLDQPRVLNANLVEDRSALRSVAAPLSPDVSIPSSGRPYVGFAITPTRGAFVGPPERSRAMMASAALIIESIDGRPYPSLEIDGWCDEDTRPVRCYLQVVGASPESGGRGTDSWSAMTTAATGWAIDPTAEVNRILEAVPRRLGREAERIARSDAPTLAAIETFETMFGFAWDPATPGIVTVQYTRDCPTAGLSGRLAMAVPRVFADTGVCLDLLRVRVDLATDSVVGTEFVPG